jgi:signal-transduction protein with cAMP-binding, CBS, and nucleotidyltransferase domain
MTNQYDKTNWNEFLTAFSRRHRLRRARLEQFNQQPVIEENQEAQLERIAVELSGANAPLVIITRLDNFTEEPQVIVNSIPHVQRIGSQLDTDHSESGLEIEDKNRALTILRMKSMVGGAS